MEKKRRQEEPQLDDQQAGSTATDQLMQGATSSQDLNGSQHSQHRGKRRSDEQEEEMPGKWRKEADRRTQYKRGNEEDDDGRGKQRSRIGGTQEDLMLDLVHDVRTNMEDEEGCVDVVRDMEQKGETCSNYRKQGKKRRGVQEEGNCQCRDHKEPSGWEQRVLARGGECRSQ